MDTVLMTADPWSLPERDVRSRALTLLDEGEAAVLATVVDVEGSAYRRPGAKMLIAPDGVTGNITAGCLEDEVGKLAASVREAGSPRLERYDLTSDDDVWGLGTGCNGIIDVLLEPLSESHRAVLGGRTESGPAGRVVVLEGGDEPFQRGTYLPDEGFDGELPDAVRTGLREAVDDLVRAGRSRTVSADGVRAFVDGLAPLPELVVVGTGPDVPPVVELARNVDFRVTVVGFRGARATPERFPQADAVHSTSPGRLQAVHDFDESTYVVLMTHNFVDDQLALESLLDTPVPYVGLLGPRNRFEELREAMADDGTTLAEADRDRIYTPVGLDLGAGTPYGIAHSIVAEVLTVANGRPAQHLCDRETGIHDAVEDEDAPAATDGSS